jgi:hypothetical protein
MNHTTLQTRSIFLRKGFGTLEIVIITAVLLTVAMLFRTTFSNFADRLLAGTFRSDILVSIEEQSPGQNP